MFKRVFFEPLWNQELALCAIMKVRIQVLVKHRRADRANTYATINRVRMCYWRQWQKPRNKVTNLLKRGMTIQPAVACSITSKGSWRNSKTPGIQQALSNDYLSKEGLISLQSEWINVHYPNE